VYAVAFNMQGDRLASASGDGQLTIWDLGSRSPRNLENKDHAVIFGIAFNSNGDRLASGGASGILRLWDVTSGSQIWEQNIVDALPAAEKQEWAFGGHG
jgi:WD40 repeat protein